jgi:hypothetical protein
MALTMRHKRPEGIGEIPYFAVYSADGFIRAA